ncbi:MAG: hypothetical protein K2Y37_21450 [Pirellulales bacterium]|nr:hypothetical protein [Pirellulales bacterium]
MRANASRFAGVDVAEVLQNLLANTKSIAAVLAIGLAMLGAGRPIWQRLQRGATSDGLTAVAWSLALGWLAAAAALLPLAALGWMSPAWVSAPTVVAAIFGLAEVMQLVAAARFERALGGRTPTTQPTEAGRPQRAQLAVLFAAAVIVLVATLISALAPPTEALDAAGPLWSAKQFVEPSLDDPRLTNAPLVAIGFAWAIALDGPVAAGLLAWSGGLWLLLATFLIAREVLGNRWGTVAGPVMFAVPAVGVAMTMPLGATALAGWITLAWHTAQQRRLGLQARGGWTTLLGICLGAAIATDARAWMGIAALTALIAWQAITWFGWYAARRDLRRVAVATLLVAGSAFLLSSAPWHYLIDGELSAIHVAARPGMPTWYAIVEQLGPLLWMFVPVLAVVRRLRGLQPLLLLAAGLLASAVVTRQMPLALAATGPLAIGAIWVFVEINRWPCWPRRAAHALAAMALVAGGTVAIVDAIPKSYVAMGSENRASYLLRTLPGYRAALVMNEAFGDDARTWSNDCAGIYLSGPVVADIASREATGGKANDPGRGPLIESAPHLRSRAITHALISEPVRGDRAQGVRSSHLIRQRAAWWSQAVESDGATGARLAADKREPEFRLPEPGDDGGIYCVSDYVAGDPMGNRRRYRLLLIR